MKNQSKKLWIVALSAAILLAPSCNNNNDDVIKPLNECSWAKIQRLSKSGEARDHFAIGDTKEIKVNGQIHKVRIIGFDQDVDRDGNKIGITFEFADLLSDENGYSLAAYWNDVNSTDTANHNYMNSTMRAVLNGNNYDKSSKAEIKWFQYFGANEDTEETGKNRHFSETYNNKSVLSMLPKDLTKVLATPSKYINILNEDSVEWEEKTIDDKLFLLSPREMGSDEVDPFLPYPVQEVSTTTYAYYDGHTEATDEIRTKHQIKFNEGARNSLLNNVDGEYVNIKSSGAGYNGDTEIDDAYGGIYWLRSPYALDDKSAWIVLYDGYVGNTTGISSSLVNSYALPIAPAFCI